jgi:hypothetical protein
VRVDLYGTDQGVKFGELTNYCHAGTVPFRPREFGIEVAKDWVPDYSNLESK